MNKSYLIRTCVRNPEGQLVPLGFKGPRGFIWPEEVGSIVVAPDWNPDPHCGHGLHGLRPGDQKPGLWATGPDAVWMVCSYDPETAVVLEGKIKVPSCVVEYVVDVKDSASTLVPLWLRNHGVTEPIYHGVMETHLNSNVGDFGFVRTGSRCTVAAGDWGIAIAESYATVKAGHMGIAFANANSLATAGDCGFAFTAYKGESVAGYYGRAATGDFGTATAGDGGVAHATRNGIAIVGEGGTATSGQSGKSIAGDYGTAITGLGGCAQAGYDGIIQIQWYNYNINRIQIATGYVGLDGIEPNILYSLGAQGKFVKTTDEGRT